MKRLPLGSVNFLPDEFPDNSIIMGETAYSKTVIIQKLLQYDGARLEHLLKLYYYKNLNSGQYIPSWINTVYKSTIRTYKNNKTNKLPTQKFLYENLWVNAEDCYEGHHNGFLESLISLGYPKVQSNVEGSAKFCASYFQWLARELSRKGEVSLDEVENKLKYLLDNN
jgi:hypothetical protein